ncbi:mangetout [Haematobia irritans]|uniref:mangetout n=1 Tax=Haematobia irritans TaxID=7368 RepID=UPI003F4F6693
MIHLRRMYMKMLTILLAIILLKRINGLEQEIEVNHHPTPLYHAEQLQLFTINSNSSSENIGNMPEVVGDIDEAARTEATKYVDIKFPPLGSDCGGGESDIEDNVFEDTKVPDVDTVGDDSSNQIFNGDENNAIVDDFSFMSVEGGEIADAVVQVKSKINIAKAKIHSAYSENFMKNHKHFQQEQHKHHKPLHNHDHNQHQPQPNHHGRHHQGVISHQKENGYEEPHYKSDNFHQLYHSHHHHHPHLAHNPQRQDNNYPFENHKNHHQNGKSAKPHEAAAAAAATEDKRNSLSFAQRDEEREIESQKLFLQDKIIDYENFNYQNDESHLQTSKPKHNNDFTPKKKKTTTNSLSSTEELLHNLPLTTEYPYELFESPDDFFFDNDITYPRFILEQEQQQQEHGQQQIPFMSPQNPQDYFAASPRSGRHRGRISGNHHHHHRQHQQQHQPHHPHYHHLPQQNSLLQQPFVLSTTSSTSSVGSSSSSKKFRSLPESEQDFMLKPRLLHGLVPLQQSHWPIKREAIVEGDVILGGLMMVHSREDNLMCGPIMPQGGIQALEAMLYTIDRINERGLLPNITLGAHILDDCDKDSYGLEMAVDFIKGSISNIDDAEYHCNKTQVRKVISGVVGAASSVTSIQVANLLRLFRIPQVSFFSTSPELSNKQRFEYFSRTIPSDHYQVKAMVEIVKRLGWSYVSIIYEESNYGIKAFEELEELLARHNICIAVKEKLVKDSGVADETAYNSIVLKLLTKPRARGAIIFGSDQEVREVMRAVRRNNATGAFSWIGSDGWSARNLVSDGNEPEVEGTLSVQPQANPVKGFEEYFLNLTVENNLRNPWFVEFWEDHFQCRYPGSSSTPYNNYNRTCSKTERLSREDTDFEDQLQFVSDAVMAFAYALRDMHRELCGGKPSLCDAMKPTKGADLLRFLRKVEFEGLSGDNFRFDSNGDGPARYNIIHFKQSKEGQYNWVKVGEYYEGELRLNMSEVQFKLLNPKPPESVCSLECERGQAKKYVEGESCCWHCFNCSTYQIRHPTDETQCLTCQLGTLPDATKQYCQTIPEVYLRPESAWAIGAMAFSATGILVTLFVVGVFVRHNDTPIVRASGRELSYILLAGILMCYAVTFALVLKPTNVVCAIQRFAVGFCFTVVYAALLTKTNRIARIFKAGKQSAKRPSFISPKSQLVICSFLISLQILINGVWMLIAPSHAMHHHPTREDNLLVCDSYIDASYVIAFFYPIVLIVVCTVYAVLTRKIPEAFNESKHIGFTMYTTCVIWLAFVPLYFGTANHVPLRITSMSVTISLSASVTIACLFSPKLYIILIRPERNVRQSMMPPRSNMHRTANTGPSSMMAAAVVTAATCAQEEKIQKHITPTNTDENSSVSQKKKLCEMATQTITISSIFTNLDSSAYQQIPYADQYVPNYNHNDKEELPLAENNTSSTSSLGNEAQVVANNNKINQQQHCSNMGNCSGAANPVIGSTATTTNAIASSLNGLMNATALPFSMNNVNHVAATAPLTIAAATSSSTMTTVAAATTMTTTGSVTEPKWSSQNNETTGSTTTSTTTASRSNTVLTTSL